MLARGFAVRQPLVDRATWQRVQARFESHARQPRQASGRYLLAGFIRCPACGARMGGEIVPTGRRYRCASTHRAGAGDPVCNQTAHQELVDRLVLAEISAVIERLAAADSALQKGLRSAWARLAQPDQASDRKRDIRRIEQAAATARARITRGTELFVDGSVDRDAYDALVAKARAELAADESDLALIRGGMAPAQVLPPLETVLEMVGGWTAALTSADIVEQRDVLSALVERVIPDRVKTGRYAVAIQWTPLGAWLRSATVGLGPT